MQSRLKRTLIAVAALALSACCTGPCKSCEALAEAMTQLAVRCDGADPAVARKQFLQAAPGSTCKNTRGIREAAALHNVCLPRLPTLSCAEVQSSFPDACKDQLVWSTQ